uniref:TLC domain-containing protein n=1 Tax=Chromera velia CCMP2878 TaxID=1169474 RepID=A0A0G4HLF7_9ALVE|eukprot:Cvel_28736.t1-p1 / transcript=Cvel_28736.t1 / gene=Cvel_28736 / organism=Chromera_velia_CCMP2878 / gene_product=hypothetical protein / transcript_product=hypothetical protein / location=Cvel_scaffold3819:318-968(+) / protein_length=217 / sequence_SO=supercontig / SO=protein_coding / is_pseudo=false
MLLFPLSVPFFKIRWLEFFMLFVTGLTGVYGVAYLDIFHPGKSYEEIYLLQDPSLADGFAAALYLFCFVLFCYDFTRKLDKVMIVHHICCMAHWGATLLIYFKLASFPLWISSGCMVHTVPGWALECGVGINHVFNSVRRQRPEYVIPAVLLFLGYFIWRDLFLLHVVWVQSGLKGDYVARLSVFIVFLCNLDWTKRIIKGILDNRYAKKAAESKAE